MPTRTMYACAGRIGSSAERVGVLAKMPMNPTSRPVQSTRFMSWDPFAWNGWARAGGFNPYFTVEQDDSGSPNLQKMKLLQSCYNPHNMQTPSPSDRLGRTRR